VFAGTSVTFTGSGTDPEDGALTDAALAWSSSLDGALGTGASLSVTTLTAGMHLVTLTGTDSGGNAATATRTLTVLPMNAAPTVSITVPADNTQVSAGTNVVFSAMANDPEDGALSGNAVRWNSDLDGQLGTGVSVSTAGLSVGTHTITVTATDSGGRAASTSVHVIVAPGASNIPPIARITGPATGQATQALSFAADTSSDADGTITGWRFAFSDGPPDVTGSTTATHTFATPGTYTVTLTVTDDDGATATATLTITITPFIRLAVVASSDSASTSCGLVARGSTLHVAWFSPLHPTVMYGTFTNGTLTPEVVDALGFNTGGDVGGEVRLIVNAAGAPVIAYRRNSEVWLATKNGSTWVRERADDAGTAFTGGALALAIDTTGRIAVAYRTTSNNERVAVALRAVNGSWSRTLLSPGDIGTFTYLALRGDIAFTSTGTLLVPVYLTTSSTSYLLAWNGTTTVSLLTPIELDSQTSIAMSGTHAYVLTGAGLLDVALATSFPTSTVTRSWYETTATSQHTVAVGTAGEPRLVINHASGLEHIVPASQPGFWNRFDLGTVGSGRIDADVDSNGDTRACFFRSGKLMLY
jgi:PKD repeat protein